MLSTPKIIVKKVAKPPIRVKSTIAVRKATAVSKNNTPNVARAWAASAKATAEHETKRINSSRLNFDALTLGKRYF